jgi:hypothetical protein
MTVGDIPLSQDVPNVSILIIRKVISMVPNIFLELWERSHLQKRCEFPEVIEFIGEEVLQSAVCGGLQSGGFQEQ